MAYFAVINEGIVENVIVADSKEIAEEVTKKQCVEYNWETDDVAIGYSYTNGKIVVPKAPPREPGVREE